MSPIEPSLTYEHHYLSTLILYIEEVIFFFIIIILRHAKIFFSLKNGVRNIKYNMHSQFNCIISLRSLFNINEDNIIIKKLTFRLNEGHNNRCFRCLTKKILVENFSCKFKLKKLFSLFAFALKCLKWQNIIDLYYMHARRLTYLSFISKLLNIRSM